MNPQDTKAVHVSTDTEQKGWFGSGVASSREKNLVIVALVFGLLVLCLLCAIVMTIVLGTLFPKQEFCLTPHCVKKAGSILMAMNMTANPCENFFNFVCGGWVDRFDVDEGSEIAIMGKIQTKIYRKLDRIIEEVKSSQNMSLDHSTDNKDDIALAGIKAIKTYDLCNNLYDQYKSANVVSLMTTFGGWPMGTPSWKTDGKSIEEKLDAVLGDFGVGPLFSISLEPVDDDPTKNIIIISPPDPVLITDEDWNITFSIAKSEGNDEAEIKDEIKNVKTLLKNIAEQLELDEEEETTTVGELGTHLTIMKIDWLKLHRLLLEGQEKPENKDKISNLKVVLRRKNVINEILNKANSAGEKVLNNYFAMSVLQHHPLLTIKESNPGMNTHQQHLTTMELLTKLKVACLETVATNLNFAMDHVFVYNQKKSTRMAEELIYFVRRAFMELIERYDWLDSGTRMGLMKKLEEMNKFVDYPKWLDDKEQVDEYYKDYEVKSTPAEAYANMVKFAVRKYFATYNETTNRNKWPKLNMFSVSTVNAFYIPHQNNFVLPRAILNPPIYDEKNPKYLTFGSLGAIIGHEITHGFDSEGRNHDEKGKVSQDMWSSFSTQNYNKLSKCFVDQYSKYVVDEATHTTVNGNKTLGENIADNGGLRQALMAYHMWMKAAKNGQRELPLPGLAAYSPEQMFFVSYGQTWCISAGKKYLRAQVKTDEHTPHYYRVIGTVSNMKEFASAFACPTESKMNPVDKCVLW